MLQFPTTAGRPTHPGRGTRGDAPHRLGPARGRSLRPPSESPRPAAEAAPSRRRLETHVPRPGSAREEAAAAPPEAIRWQRQHAHRRAQRSSSGIGVAVVRCRPDDWGRPRYTCLATDGTTRRYLEVRAPDLRWGETIVPEALESEIERFAGRLPEPRLHRLVNANPLHVARDGGVAD